MGGGAYWVYGLSGIAQASVDDREERLPAMWYVFLVIGCTFAEYNGSLSHGMTGFVLKMQLLCWQHVASAMRIASIVHCVLRVLEL